MRDSWLYCLGVATVLLSSCASEREVTYEKAEATGLSKYQSDVKYMVDEQGNVKPTGQGQRSQFEAKGNYYQAQSQMGSEYAKPEYSASRWQQNTSYSKKTYANGNGSRDYKNSPHFVQQQASVQGQQSNVGGQNFAGTNEYYRSDAQAGGVDASVSKPTDAGTSNRNLPAPKIYTLGEVNQLGVDDTNSMLGR